MLADDPVGAGNFAMYFIASYQTMYDAKDDSLYQLVAGPDCEFCANALASYATFIAEDQTVVGGEITSTMQLALGNPQGDGSWLVQFPIDIAPVVYTATDGTVVENVEAKKYDVGVSLQLVDGKWVVLGANLKVRP